MIIGEGPTRLRIQWHRGLKEHKWKKQNVLLEKLKQNHHAPDTLTKERTLRWTCLFRNIRRSQLDSVLCKSDLFHKFKSSFRY